MYFVIVRKFPETAMNSKRRCCVALIPSHFLVFGVHFPVIIITQLMKIMMILGSCKQTCSYLLFFSPPPQIRFE